MINLCHFSFAIILICFQSSEKILRHLTFSFASICASGQRSAWHTVKSIKCQSQKQTSTNSIKQPVCLRIVSESDDRFNTVDYWSEWIATQKFLQSPHISAKAENEEKASESHQCMFLCECVLSPLHYG